MTTDQLHSKAKAAFEYNKKENVLYGTTDGHMFLEKAKSHAQNYASKNGVEVVKITRDEVMGDAPNSNNTPKVEGNNSNKGGDNGGDPSAEEAAKAEKAAKLKAAKADVAAINDAETVEAVQAIAEGKTAPSVKKAAEARIKALEEAAATGSEESGGSEEGNQGDAE